MEHAAGQSAATGAGSTSAGREILPRRFGRYQLFDAIGRGGMASIYLARMESELGADRLVVVKQIHAELSRDSSFSAQFVDEAKLSAGLRHANIAQVVDLGRATNGADELLFMAMEYVEGLDLQQLLRRVAQRRIPIPPEFAFLIVRETLAGLDFAHRAAGPNGRPLGIVHRDVSPSNVLLSFEGEVKLCDFGIAKAFAGDASADGTRIVGKSAYMAPEQARGEVLDGRADAFAAGILLWEMCAGRRLYKGTEAEMLAMAREAAIPSLPERGLPSHEALQAFFDRALAPNRDERFASAREMMEALDAYVAANRLFASPLRFASFLTDHFGEEVVAERRARERAARALARGPAVELRPIGDVPREGSERADDTDPVFATGRSETLASQTRELDLGDVIDSGESDAFDEAKTIAIGALSLDAAERIASSAGTVPSPRSDAGRRTPTRVKLPEAETRPEARSSNVGRWIVVAIACVIVAAAATFLFR